jgi:hypothetical protein
LRATRLHCGMATTYLALTASYFLLTRCARPSGQPAAVTPLRYVGSRKRESNQRESAPDIPVSLRSTPLAPALLRGSARWAILGPTCLVWPPCQTPLYATPALSLLTGVFGPSRLSIFCCVCCGQQINTRRDKRPFSAGRTQSLRSGLSGRMPRELCWAMDGPSQRAHGAMIT